MKGKVHEMKYSGEIEISINDLYKSWEHIFTPIKVRNINPQSLDVFKSSIGKTVIIIFDNERKNDLPISLPSKRVGIIENINSNKVWLNVNGCLEVYPFEVIKVMTQEWE